MDAHQFQAKINLPFIDRVQCRCVTHICGHVAMFRLGIFPDKERRRQQKTAQIKHQT